MATYPPSSNKNITNDKPTLASLKTAATSNWIESNLTTSPTLDPSDSSIFSPPSISSPDSRFTTTASPFTPTAPDHSLPNKNNKTQFDPPLHTSTSSSATSSQAIFQQLNTIKLLQEEISQSHSKLEGIGSNSTNEQWYKDLNTAGGGTSPERKKEKGNNSASKDGLSDSKEMIGSYENMSEEFKERAKGVGEIMLSLSKLSTALKTFHALPAPQLFPSSQIQRHSSDSNSKQGTRADTLLTVESERPLYGRRLSYD